MKQLILVLASAVALCARAAPDEAGYGADRGWPVAERGRAPARDELVGTFSGYDQLYTTRAVRAGGTPRPLPPWGATPDWRFVDDYLDSHPATGLIVLKDGKVVLERYQYGRTAQHRFVSASMAKTIVGMALGIAVAEGRIASIDDPVDRYEPALASTPWKGIAIRHVLSMSSGVAFDETYDKPGTDIAKLSAPWAAVKPGSLLQSLQRFEGHDAKPGERFKYISADTQVLAQVLVKATGEPLADYVGRKMWAPMGAEADAAWVVDGEGMEAGYCCFQARLRDWARLGQLLLDGGQRDGQSIIPRDWVDAATTVRLRDFHLQPRRATPYFGYGYQTWIFPDNLGFALQGVRGQAVFVHPRLKLVMVQTAVWPASSSPDLGRQRDLFWRELVLRAARL